MALLVLLCQVTFLALNWFSSCCVSAFSSNRDTFTLGFYPALKTILETSQTWFSWFWQHDFEIIRFWPDMRYFLKLDRLNCEFFLHNVQLDVASLGFYFSFVEPAIRNASWSWSVFSIMRSCWFSGFFYSCEIFERVFLYCISLDDCELPSNQTTYIRRTRFGVEVQILLVFTEKG